MAEVVSPQLLVPKALKIKRMTRDQSSVNSVVLTSWCELHSPGGMVCMHIFSFLTEYGPPFSLHLHQTPLRTSCSYCCIAQSREDTGIFHGGEMQVALIGSSFSSASKSLVPQAELLPYSTLLWNTISASFDARFMALPIGKLLL